MTNTGEAWKYFRPIFARGKTNTKTATGTYDDDDNVFTLNNAGGEYVIGDDVFVSVDDDTLPLYLGEVTAASAGSITTVMALSGGYSTATITLWEPTASWRPKYGIDVMFSGDVDYGVNTRQKPNGLIQNTKVRGVAELFHVGFTMDESDWLIYQAFFAVTWERGLNNIAFAFFDQRLNASRLVTVNRVMEPERTSVNQATNIIKMRHRLQTMSAVYPT